MKKNLEFFFVKLRAHCNIIMKEKGNVFYIGAVTAAQINTAYGVLIVIQNDG